MGYVTKIQVIQRANDTRQFYCICPAPLAEALELEKGEAVEWVVKDRDTLILHQRFRLGENVGGNGVSMGDNETLLPGVSLAPVREGGRDPDEGEQTAEARLKVVDRTQMLLRTVDVEHLIGEDHPARAIWEFVGQLDLSGFTEKIRSVAGTAGRPALDPQLLVSLWVYSYSRGVSSARAIERLCEYDPAYQWLTGMEGIGGDTLSDFRVAHAEALQELFVQTLGLLSAEGLVTLERVMVDGTKVRASASSSGFRRKPRIEEHLKQAREAVEELDAQTEEAARVRARRERQERLESAVEEFDKLKAVKSRVNRVSTTDPEARLMKQPEGAPRPATTCRSQRMPSTA